jgi:hypothetical protein
MSSGVCVPRTADTGRMRLRITPGCIELCEGVGGRQGRHTGKMGPCGQLLAEIAAFVVHDCTHHENQGCTHQSRPPRIMSALLSCGKHLPIGRSSDPSTARC